MNASSRPVDTRSMLGLLHMKMLQSKTVQENSLLRLSVLLSANVMVFWLTRSRTIRSIRKSLSLFLERLEHQSEMTTKSFSFWTTVAFTSPVQRKWKRLTLSLSGILHTNTSSTKHVRSTGLSWSNNGGRCFSKGCWSLIQTKTCCWLRLSKRPSCKLVMTAFPSILRMGYASSMNMPTNTSKCSIGTSWWRIELRSESRSIWF